MKLNKNALLGTAMVIAATSWKFKGKSSRIGAVLVIAASTGFMMQNGGAIAAKFSDDTVLPAVEGTGAPAELAKSLIPNLPADISVPALAMPVGKPVSTQIAALDVGFKTRNQTDFQTPPPFILTCDVQFSAETKPAAMIGVTLKAPCQANSAVTFRHAGLEFSALTDDTGAYNVDIPALSQSASVNVEFEDGREMTTAASIPDLENYVRTALLWRDKADLHIHALEFGAEYGENGHVWSEESRDPEYSVLARGGFLTELGQDVPFGAKFAEIYSFPAGQVLRSGTVRVVVEAGIDEQTCGTKISGRTIELDATGITQDVDLEMTMPDCDAVGGYLVLKNLLQDLNIAQN